FRVDSHLLRDRADLQSEIHNRLASDRQSHAASHGRLESRQLCRNFVTTQRQLRRVVSAEFIGDHRARSAGIGIRQFDAHARQNSARGIFYSADDSAGRDLRYRDATEKQQTEKFECELSSNHAMLLPNITDQKLVFPICRAQLGRPKQNQTDLPRMLQQYRTASTGFICAPTASIYRAGAAGRAARGGTGYTPRPW